MTYDSLYGFRQRAHQYLGRAHDATFELIDAVLTTHHVYSFAELSPSPLFRRQWSSAYEALEDSRRQRQRGTSKNTNLIENEHEIPVVSGPSDSQ